MARELERDLQVARDLDEPAGAGEREAVGLLVVDPGLELLEAALARPSAHLRVQRRADALPAAVRADDVAHERDPAAALLGRRGRADCTVARPREPVLLGH
jgi:hypothetical protein